MEEFFQESLNYFSRSSKKVPHSYGYLGGTQLHPLEWGVSAASFGQPFDKPFDKLKALSLSKGSVNPEQTTGLGPGKVEGLICVTSRDGDRDGSEGSSSMETDNTDNNMDRGMDNNRGRTGTRSNRVQAGVADGIPC